MPQAKHAGARPYMHSNAPRPLLKMDDWVQRHTGQEQVTCNECADHNQTYSCALCRCHMQDPANISKKERNLREAKQQLRGLTRVNEVLTGSTGSIRPFAPARAIASMQGMVACRNALN